jgi:predicted ATPase
MEDTTRLFPVLYGLCVLHVVRAERQPAHDLSSQLDALAEETKSPLLRLQACHAIWTALVAEGELVKARDRLEEGMALYNREEHASQAPSYGGHDPGVCCLAFDALALWALGYPDRALSRAREALALARDLSHPVSIGQAQCYTAMLHQLRREAPAAREYAHGSITVTRDWVFPQFLSYGNVLHGWARGEIDNAEEGLIEIREGLAAAKAMENRFLLPHWLALSADTSRKAGRTDEGLAAAEEGLREVRSNGQSFSESELHRLKGEILLLRLERDEAEACFRQAIDVARRQSARSFELRAALSLARLWQSQRRTAEAGRMLEEVYGWFTEGFDTPDLVEARATLGELS